MKVNIYIFIVISLFVSCSKPKEENIDGAYVRIGKKTVDSLILKSDHMYSRKIIRKLDRKLLYNKTSRWSFDKKDKGIKFFDFYVSSSEDFTDSDLPKQHYIDGEFGVNTFIENNFFNVLYFEVDKDKYKKVD